MPSGSSSFQSPHGPSYPPPYISALAQSNSSSFSTSSSLYGSPTTSTYPFSRRDSAVAGEADCRRRTWHPTTYTNYSRPATSGLSYYQTPDAPRPAFAPQAAAINQPHRLPGIESFVNLSHPSPTPPPGVSSPMQVDQPSRAPTYAGPSEHVTSGPNDRRGHPSWVKSLHQNIPRLDVGIGPLPKDAGLWGQQTVAEIHEAAARPPETARYPAPPAFAPFLHPESQKRSAESMYLQPVTPVKAKRQGWYQGPPQPLHSAVLHPRISPEDSSSSEGLPTPSSSAAEYHPAIIHSNGYIESQLVSGGGGGGNYPVGCRCVPPAVHANWVDRRASIRDTHRP